MKIPFFNDKKKIVSAATAVDALRRHFIRDPDFAHTWHANIACAAMDEGLDPKRANQAASRFMFSAFCVRTSDQP